MAHCTDEAVAVLEGLEGRRRRALEAADLRERALDAVGRFVTATVRHRSFADTQRKAAAPLLRAERELLDRLAARLDSPAPAPLNPDRFRALCAQEIPDGNLTQSDGQPDLDDCVKVRTDLMALRGAGGAVEAVADAAVRRMDAALARLEASTLHSRPWAQVVRPVVVLLRDVAHAVPASGCLVLPEEAARRLRFEVEECGQLQADAIAEGEMTEAERLYYRKIELQEALGRLLDQKLAALEAEEDAAYRIPLRQVHGCHANSAAALNALLEAAEARKRRVDGDLERLRAQVERVGAENAAREATFAADTQGSDHLLRRNAEETEACWRQIEELEGRLGALADERYREVSRRVEALDEEARRRAAHRQFAGYAGQREALLRRTLRDCAAAEAATDAVDALVCDACTALERRMREVEREMEQLKLDIHEEHLQAFRGLYLTLGDLQFKKERTVEELDKRIHLTVIRQECAMETLDPKAKEFSQERKALLAQRQQMEEQLDGLRGASVRCLEGFRPSEQALIEAGRDFVHPVEELEDINASRTLKLIEYHTLMSGPEKEEAELAVETAEIERLRMLTEGTRPRQLTAPPTGTPTAAADLSLRSISSNGPD